jgi:hypothetical protein
MIYPYIRLKVYRTRALPRPNLTVDNSIFQLHSSSDCQDVEDSQKLGTVESNVIYH